jgi:hypothetical protein
VSAYEENELSNFYLQCIKRYQLENTQQVKKLHYDNHILYYNLKFYFLPCKHVGSEDQGCSHLGCGIVILAPVYQNTRLHIP